MTIKQKCPRDGESREHKHGLDRADHLQDTKRHRPSQDEFVQYLAGLAPDGETVLIVEQKQVTKNGAPVLHGDGTLKCVWLPQIPSATREPERAWYANTGSFILDRMTARLSASKDNCEYVLCMVLDDIGTKSKTPPLEPTWIIETSPDNFQWGYAFAFDEQPTKEEFTAAIKAIAAVGYTDPGATNAVRNFRIPGSVNLKPGRDGFVSALVEFNPEREFTLGEICAALGVEPGAPVVDFQAVRLSDTGTDPVLKWLDEQGLVLGRPNSAGWVSIVCPNSGEHTDGDPAAYYHPADHGFCCHHGHCEHLGTKEFLTWVAEHEGPAVSHGVRDDVLQTNVAAALEKIEKPAALFCSDTVEEPPGEWGVLLNLRSLATSEPRDPESILGDGILPVGYASLISAHGSAGKSFIVLFLAVCVATGRDFFGLRTSRRRVLFLSCEDRTSVLHWRLKRICDFLGLRLTDLEGWLDLLDLVGFDTVLYHPAPYAGSPRTHAYERLKRRMNGLGSELLIIDGVSDSFGGNENSRSEVKAFINSTLALIPPDRGAVLLISHVSKMSAGARVSEGYSGSTGWHNGVRSRLYLYPETNGAGGRTGAMLLEHQKSNLGALGATMRFRWDDTSRLFVGTVVSDEAGPVRDAREQEALLSLIAASPGYVPAASSGQRTAYNVLSAMPEFPDSLHGDTGKRRFWRHLEVLRSDGLLTEELISRGNRHRVSVLVIARIDEKQAVEKGLASIVKSTIGAETIGATIGAPEECEND